ncbi:MAG: hypothetical protein ACE1ZQ_09635 [Ignavibacteriaceae bacterium]
MSKLRYKEGDTVLVVERKVTRFWGNEFIITINNQPEMYDYKCIDKDKNIFGLWEFEIDHNATEQLNNK